MTNKYDIHPNERNFNEWDNVQKYLSSRNQVSIDKDRLKELKSMLSEAEVYVRAYKCQCSAPEGIDGASRLLKRMSGND